MFLYNDVFVSLKVILILANSVDSDEMQYYAAFHLGFHCLPKNPFMPRSHIHGSPRWFYYGLNLTDDPGYATFCSPIRMHYIRMIKYYYVWLRMQYWKLRTNTDCHEWCRIVSVANPVSSLWMCDLGIRGFQYTQT